MGLYMPKFVSLLINQAHHRYLRFGLFLFTFVVMLLVGVGLCGHLIHQRMSLEAQYALEPHLRLHDSVSSTLLAMNKALTAEPCSLEFHSQLQGIAFLPDGLNEFLFVSDSLVRCSVNANFAPHDLGVADHLDRSGTSIWYDEPLDFLGRAGVIGTIVLHGNFGIVVPPQPEPELSTHWMRYEVVDITSNGGHRHRAGDAGVYNAVKNAGPLAAYLPINSLDYGSLACLPDGRTCVGTTVGLGNFTSANSQWLIIGMLLSGVLALSISGQLQALLLQYWSFQARFKRHFNPSSIICTYQPIMSLRTGMIHGCEVLVRWRDVDGSIVYPDQFLPVVEKFGLGRKLTNYVVARAFEELTRSVPTEQFLQISFNVFPRDLDAVWLRNTLLPFASLKDRFEVVVEVVETDQMQIEHALQQIDALHRFGIKTHLDDFGTAYSNIENLARLPIEALSWIAPLPWQQRAV